MLTAAFTAFVVIHNGIITNYKELREYLVSQSEAVNCDVCADKSATIPRGVHAQLTGHEINLHHTKAEQTENMG